MAAAVSLAPLLALAGCYNFSFALPPALDEQEQSLVDSTHFAARVAVAPHEADAWEAVALLECLRQTRVFEEVGILGQMEDPDLIAVVRGTADYAHPSVVSSMNTMVSLGVIPTIVRDQWATIFSLHPMHGRPAAQPEAADPSTGEDPGPRAAPAVEVDFRVNGQMHVGVLAFFTGLVPSRTWAAPPMTHRYSQALALAICRQAPEIEAMTAASRRAAAADPTDQ